LGPALATALQSEQTFASSVQALACGTCCTCGFEQADSTRIASKEEIRSKYTS